MNIQIFSRLPQDTINVILEFYGKIKYKNGKYINIIHKYDFRYALLSTIKLPVSNEYAELFEITLPQHFEYKVQFNHKHTLRVYNLYTPPDGIRRIFEARDTVGLSSAQVLLKPDEIVYFFENIIDGRYGVYKRK
jgi:hypothetical protein